MDSLNILMTLAFSMNKFLAKSSRRPLGEGFLDDFVAQNNGKVP